MLFYEDGEPIIDGESGDLRVSSSVFTFVSNCLVFHVMMCSVLTINMLI